MASATTAPGTIAPGTIAPGTIAPGTIAPGTIAPGTIAPGTIAAASPSRSRSGLLRSVLMLGGIAAVAAVSLWWWVGGGRIVSIDDAYVRASKLAVTDDISGVVGEVAVKEGQHVKKGDLLFRLQDRQVQIALAAARANLAETALTLEALKRDYVRMLRDVDVRAAQVQADQASYDRYANLVKGGGVTRAETDDARFKLAADRASLDSLKEQAAVQLARLGGNPDVDIATMPQYALAKTRIDEQQRQLDHTQVHAPFDGIVTNVEATQPGMFLTAGTAAFGLVSDKAVWVEANPKETELTYVRPGNPITVTVDTYPGHVWHGIVESIAPASAAEFAVLPAQNASGNWVKVVQRLPVRLRVDRQPGDPDLRAGMSVIAEIDTGHERHLSDLMP